MGEYPWQQTSVPPSKRLTAEDQARVLEKLRRLELEVLFDPEHVDVLGELKLWFWLVRVGSLPCSEVPRLAAAFERFGVS